MYDPFGDRPDSTIPDPRKESAPVTPSGPWWQPVHFSRLKHFAKCAALYQWYCQHESEDTKSRRLGRGWHALTLTGGGVVCYDGKRDQRSDAWRRYQAEHSQDEILIASEYDVVQYMTEATLANGHARELLESCPEREVTVASTLLGFPCEGRVDARGPGRMLELKSDRISDPLRWQRGALWYGYPAQLDWYRHLEERLTDECYAIVCPNTPPFLPSLIVVHHLTERNLLEGRRSWRLWLEQLRTCVDSDCWPGYAESIVEWDATELEQGEAVPFEEESAA